MLLKVSLSALLFCLGSSVLANELDQDTANQGLRGSVVVRVDQRSNAVSVLKTEAPIQSQEQAEKLAGSHQFTAAAIENVKSELDQSAGASSWYWYCGYNYPTYLYWYGYTYYPVYTYSYSYYTYYYYSWYRW